VHVVDLVVVCATAILLVICAAVLARQRYMLRAAGAIPLALRGRGSSWQYGIGRYADGELRWYRSLGLGTRPNRVFERGQLAVVSSRRPDGAELSALPASAIVVTCQVGRDETVLALGYSAYTGFVSWLEASAPSAW
jgi:hypothetical protein